MTFDHASLMEILYKYELTVTCRTSSYVKEPTFEILEGKFECLLEAETPLMVLCKA